VIFLKREDIQTALIIAFFLSIFFYQALFSGLSAVDSRIHHTDPIYGESGIKLSYNPFFRPDPSYALLYHPEFFYGHRTIKSGEIPLWNPHNAGGIPFFANFHASPFSLLKVPFYYFSLPMKAFNYYLISRLFFAGFFTYLFARKIHLSRYGATLAAISYMFCGVIIAYFQYVFTQPCLMPVLFVALQKLLITPNTSSVLIFGAAVCFIILDAHPTLTITLFTGLGLYFLVWLLSGNREWEAESIGHRANSRFLALRSTLIAGILGICLSLVAILPFLEFLKNGYSYKEDMSPDYLAYKRLDGDGLKNLAGLLISHYKTPWFASSSYISNTYAYQSYVGLVTFILALYALANRSINRSLLAVLFLGSGLAFGLAPFNVLNYVFPFRYILAEYGLVLVSFSLAVFGGMGLDVLLKQNKEQSHLGKLLGLTGFLTINFFAGFARSIDWIESPWSDWKRLQYTGVILGLIGLMYLAYLRLDYIRLKHLVTGLILLEVLDLFYNGSWVNSPQPEFHFPETTPIQILKKDPTPYRILSMDGVNRLNSGLIHQLSDIQIIDPLLVRRYHEFLRTVEELAGRPYTLDLDFYDSRFLDMMNVKYILRDTGKPIPVTEKFRLAYQDPYVLIYENLKSFPRVFSVHQAIITENSEQSLRQLKDPTLDLRSVAIVEVPSENNLRPKIESLGLLRGERLVGEPRILSHESNLQLLSYNAHRIVIEAQMEQPGLLVLADSFYPGWKVWVDGNPDIIFPTNHLLRGVYLSEGDHKVEFVYQPISYKLGLFISLSSFCLGCTAAVVFLSNKNQFRFTNVMGRDDLKSAQGQKV
jgi:hypothetical protein